MSGVVQRQVTAPGAHWEEVYSTQGGTEVSWYQEEPTLSLELIREASKGADTRVIDVGGGDSVLVDRLLSLGYVTPSVLDISAAALERAQARLGSDAARVNWLVGDITKVESLGCFDVWHDRAVFHFLTSQEERQAYVTLAEQSIPVGGHLIMATFAPNGPERCSGLPVCRYDEHSLARTVGPGFTLVRHQEEIHTTPWGATQAFTYALFRREGHLRGEGGIGRR